MYTHTHHLSIYLSIYTCKYIYTNIHIYIYISIYMALSFDVFLSHRRRRLCLGPRHALTLKVLGRHHVRRSARLRGTAGRHTGHASTTPAATAAARATWSLHALCPHHAHRGFDGATPQRRRVRRRRRVWRVRARPAIERRAAI